ncbi:hypothetical protein E2C01_024621 [Portunus trituberculatus]|uniref:Uncharacterized protein n=1 Tax=Portunus trituberculatus TaxID=210409 RepID=A0A5B7EDP0_PORTR|nr:hypothetical protein [Portunus trituberculatus]
MMGMKPMWKHFSQISQATARSLSLTSLSHLPHLLLISLSSSSRSGRVVSLVLTFRPAVSAMLCEAQDITTHAPPLQQVLPSTSLYLSMFSKTALNVDDTAHS